jgi:hypothetical protein
MQSTVQAIKTSKVQATVPVLALDPGNAYLKALIPSGQGHTPYCVPNYIYVADNFQEVSDSRDTISVYAPDITGSDVRYIIGQEAKFLKGEPLVSLGKADYVHIITKAVLQFTSENPIDLRIQVADSNLPEWSAAETRIREVCPQVRGIKFISEGTPPWKWMKENGSWAYPDMANGVIDIGGGETTCQIISPRGTVSQAKKLTLPGMYELASVVGAKLKPLGLQFSPNPGAILTSIEEGSYTYTERGAVYPFRDIFDHELSLWQKNIAKSILSSWQSSGEEFGQVLIVGGGAYLCNKLAEKFPNRFIVASNNQIENFAQMINAYALATLSF